MLSDTIRFEISGVPVPKGRPRFTKTGIAYTPAKTRSAEEAFALLATPYKPSELITDPIMLSLYFYMPIPQSASKKKQKDMAGFAVKHVGRPDLDNLQKMILDSLEGVFWHNDSQIYQINSNKWYSENPRTIVNIDIDRPFDSAIKTFGIS